MNNTNEILVSIVCLTYNHRYYIEDAIEGFLNQKVDFEYEIVIHDDCSTDGTTEILKYYEEKYPDIIRVLYEEENQYSKGAAFNSFFINKCRGKYWAFCEGDDLWIDKDKLQIQVEFMEKHPEYSLTSHNALRIFYPDMKVAPIYPYDGEQEITPEELIMQYNGNLPSASLVVKKECVMDDSFWKEVGVGDIPLQLSSLCYGKVYYFNRIMSVHRYGHAGSWTSENSSGDPRYIHCIKMIRFYDEYNIYTNYSYEEILINKMWKYIESICDLYKNNSIEYFDKKCSQIKKKLPKEYLKYIDNVHNIYHMYNDEFYLDEQIKEIVNGYDKILVFGVGMYGTRLAKQLHNNGIEIEGFIVSDNITVSKNELYKKVWNISEYGDIDDSTVIIIAVNKSLYGEVIVNIKNKFSNIYFPYGNDDKITRK